LAALVGNEPQLTRVIKRCEVTFKLKMSEEKYGDLFAKKAEEYTRQVDVLNYAITQSAFFLSKMLGQPIDVCREYVKKQLGKDGKFNFNDPKLTFFHRDVLGTGDRSKKETTLSRYIQHTLKNEELLAPTFTSYVHPKKKESLISKYIQRNIKLRSVAKKAMFAAEAVRDFATFVFKKMEQTFRKLGNNAVSGAHVSPSTPIVNPTAHSTLTSTCRSTSGYGNANNEKFLSGNRHYFELDVVLNNITSICSNTDYEKLSALMKRYHLHYPSVDDVMACIQYSAVLYWTNSKWMETIRSYVIKFNELERAAFVYTGDAYHLLKHNPEFMRTFLTKLSSKKSGTLDDPISLLKKMPGSYLNLGHQICRQESVQIEPGNYGKVEDVNKLNTIALTCENIADTIYEYRDLIDTLWMSNNLPASVAHFPSSIRRTALTSDTDSTIFTVQDWVMWYSGGLDFTETSKNIYAAVVFLTSSTITHVLATMSANFGIVTENIFKIAMKSEYSFDVFITTQLGKHYFACISCQEGLVYDKQKWEIKGAQLKSANAPRPVIAAAEEMMKGIINDVQFKQKISLTKWLDFVADQELKIVQSIKGGSMAYFRSTSIKDAKSYTGPSEQSPYANHYLWQDIWAEKYGAMPNPPYSTFKINVTTNSPAKMAAWLKSLEDRELAERFMKYLSANNKKYVATYNLPVDILVTGGIPPEIVEIIDYEKIVVDICGVFYILLESIGYYALGDKVRRLVSSEGWGSHRHANRVINTIEEKAPE
jgi:hypothetical protein